VQSLKYGELKARMLQDGQVLEWQETGK
jgi:hypothetical protein